MMKPYRYILGLFVALTVIALASCTNDDWLRSGEGESVSVTYRPTLGDGLSTRAIGDAEGIDWLTVVVYEGAGTLSEVISVSKDWDIAQRDGVTLTLIEGHTYQVLFWAADKDNTAYTITSEGQITVDYTDYLAGGFSKMEEMDAFYATSSITIGSQKSEYKPIELSRPLAQVNFADNITQPQQGIHQAVVTFHTIPTGFNPFTGSVSMTDGDVAFTFTDFPTEETLQLGETAYYYVASNYLFAPKEGVVSLPVTHYLEQADGTSINQFVFDGDKAIPLDKNKKTNVYGAIVQQP